MLIRLVYYIRLLINNVTTVFNQCGGVQKLADNFCLLICIKCYVYNIHVQADMDGYKLYIVAYKIF